jgi:uncharacterized protein YegP (UPF0339 family)
MNHFEAYEDENGKWRWRLWSAERKIVASSGEAFETQEIAMGAAKAVRRNAAGAELASEPGLGIKAALRLRALLAGDGAESAESEAVGAPRRIQLRGRTAAETVIRVKRSAGARVGIGPAATGTLV